VRAVVLVIALVAALAAALAAAPAAAAPRPVSDQVVRLSVTFQRYEERLPWARTAARTRQAMGVVVEGSYILTTAQMVADATFIEVEKHGGPVRAPARVRHIDPDINLALLAVDAPGFFDDLAPVPVAPGVAADAPLTLVRWDQGQLETAASRIARAQVMAGPGSDDEHLFFRVKSDFAGGGWAEPVFAPAGLLGLAVAQSSEREAVVVPAEIIAAYLAASRDPKAYRGFASLALFWQEDRSPAQAAWLGLEGAPRGVLVRGVPWGATGCGVLRPRDVLLALDGHEIDADGYYTHPRYGRLRFENIAVEGHLAGDTVAARVLREGKVVDLTLELRRYPTTSRLVPWSPPGRRPPYQIAGGLVFRELDRSYLTSWGKDWRQEADQRLIDFLDLEAHAQEPGRRRVVILSSVLPGAFTVGYHRLRDLPVRAVNGVPVGSLADLVEGLRHPKDGLHTVSFLPNPATDEVVLDADALVRADEEILATYRIPRSGYLEPEPLPDLGPLPQKGSAP
jgi:S1-C subfamily serine protease